MSPARTPEERERRLRRARRVGLVIGWTLGTAAKLALLGGFALFFYWLTGLIS